MKIGQLTPEQFDHYMADPVSYDAEVRRLFKLPDNRYFSITLWPENLAGEVWVDTRRERITKTEKISKSCQSPKNEN